MSSYRSHADCSKQSFAESHSLIFRLAQRSLSLSLSLSGTKLTARACLPSLLLAFMALSYSGGHNLGKAVLCLGFLGGAAIQHLAVQRPVRVRLDLASALYIPTGTPLAGGEPLTRMLLALCARLAAFAG